MKRFRKSLNLVIKILAINFAILFALLCVFEAAWHYCLHHPSIYYRLPRPFRLHLRYHYANHMRDIIQLNDNCARYDKELFYTLKPGTCTFSNIEFTTEVRINSLGVRDSEDALSSPEAAVIGDSFAMGWGVSEDKSFPALIRARTGRRLLNVSVSSYSTAREILLLNRAGPRSLKFLIVQYAPNDIYGNMFFLEHGPSGADVYSKTMAEHKAEMRYFPGKHVYDMLKDLYAGSAPPETELTARVTANEEADLFINALMKGNLDFSRTRIIVFEVARYARNNSEFTDALKDRIKRLGLPPSIRDMTVLDVSKLLTPDDYYILDDHINERGHAKLAAAIVDAMGGAGK